jgi:hypothetical protein
MSKFSDQLAIQIERFFVHNNVSVQDRLDALARSFASMLFSDDQTAPVIDPQEALKSFNSKVQDWVYDIHNTGEEAVLEEEENERNNVEMRITKASIDKLLVSLPPFPPNPFGETTLKHKK